MDVNEALKCISDSETWPPPPIVSEFRIEGDLRDRLRRIFHAPYYNNILLRETVTEGGYSEYTVEMSYDFEIVIGGDVVFSHTHDYNSDDRRNGLVKLLEWLDKKEAEGDNSISS